MENMKAQSFTETLFGPKDVSTSSPGHFGSVFGPSSMGLGKDSSHCKYSGSSKKQDYSGPKHSITDTKASYLSSSICYGGQEAYPPTTHNFTKGGVDEDPNGSSASRGNWWQGSLYY